MADGADKSGLQDGNTPAESTTIAAGTAAPAAAAKPIDMAYLKARFFPDLDRLEEQDICPSLKNFSIGDILNGSGNGELNIPFLKARQDDRPDNGTQAAADAAAANPDGHQPGVYLDPDVAPGFGDDDDDINMGGFDLPPGTGFGDGGEAWARDAAVELHHNQLAGDEEGGRGDAGGDGDDAGPAAAGATGPYDAQASDYTVLLGPGGGADGFAGGAGGRHADILSYFDDALRKQWAGPEHWRIRKIKDMTGATAAGEAGVPPHKTRKEKEPFEIDFLAPLDAKLEVALHTAAASSAAISLPKSQWRSSTRNLLPDDKHFSSKQLTHLFLKPKARLRTRRKGAAARGAAADDAARRTDGIGGADDVVDEAYWARDAAAAAAADAAAAATAGPATGGGGDEGARGNYDADFFQDDGLAFAGGLPLGDDDDEHFVDARENLAASGGGPAVNGDIGGNGPGDPNAAGSAPGGAGIPAVEGTGDAGGYGAQLVTQGRRMRPDYVQYARVAKKVDVRRLKEAMWQGMGLEAAHRQRQQQAQNQPVVCLPSRLHYTISGNLCASPLFPFSRNAFVSISIFQLFC
jgi:condensin complex subunit 2